MNCQQCTNEIEERDRRDDLLSRAAEAHLATCAACRTFSRERLSLGALVGELERVAAPPDFDFRLRARMAAGRDASRPRVTWFNLSSASVSWAMAGCLALVVAASLYFRQEQPGANVLQPQQARATSPVAVKPVETAQASTAQTPEVGAREVEQVKVELKANATPVRRRRALPVRRAEREPVEIARAGNREEGSNSSDVMGSSVRFDAKRMTESANAGALIPVQLPLPERPLKVLLRDTRGASRTISVDPVSFGSRDTIGRSPKFTNVSLPTSQGVW